MSTKLRTIRLYGKLGAKFGREFKLAVNSTAEAVRALCVQLPGFEAYLTQAKDNGMVFAVFLGKTNIGEELLRAPVGKEVIRIAPVMAGSKKQGWVNVIVGIVLVVVGVIYGYWTGDWVNASKIIIMGIGMIAGGVVQLLSPQPKVSKPKERPEDEPSYGFGGPVNTQAQGHPVPVLVGELIVGSAVVSAGIEAKDSVYVPTAPPPGGTSIGVGTTGGGGSPPWHLDWDISAA
jgi:predicted phage tail protein